MLITINMIVIALSTGGTSASTAWVARVFDAPEPVWLLVWGFSLLAVTALVRNYRLHARVRKATTRLEAITPLRTRTAEGLEG
jgi:hypothetical protein